MLIPTKDTCKPKVNWIPRNFGFWLCLICCLLRYTAGRHLASCVFVLKKEHYDFLADSSIFHGCRFLQVRVLLPHCNIVGKEANGAPTADARKICSDRIDPCGTPCFMVSVRLLTPSNVTQASWFVSHACILCTM